MPPFGAVLEIDMQVKITFEVVGDDGKPEFTDVMIWHKCDWSDVTFLQDLQVQTLDRSLTAGYVLAMGSGLATPEQVKTCREIAKGGNPLMSVPQAPTAPLPRGKG